MKGNQDSVLNESKGFHKEFDSVDTHQNTYMKFIFSSNLVTIQNLIRYCVI